MKYGLSKKQLDQVIAIIKSYPDVEAAILFGSRAINTFKEASDVDIVIKGEKANFALAARIKGHLEDETYLPFFFDIIAYNSIDNDALKLHIEKYGKVLYENGGNSYEWQECRLGDVVVFGNGKTRPKSEGNYPVYGGNGILDFCAENNYNQETIIIGRVGAYCGATYYEKRPIWVSDNALAAKAKAGNDTKYLYYVLKNLNII